MKNKNIKKISLLFVIVSFVIVSLIIFIFIQRSIFIEYTENTNKSLSELYNYSSKKNSLLQDNLTYLKKNNSINQEIFVEITNVLSSNSANFNEMEVSVISPIITNLESIESKLHSFKLNNDKNSYKELQDFETNLQALNNRLTVSIQQYNGSVKSFNKFRNRSINKLPAIIFGYDTQNPINSEIHNSEQETSRENFTSNEEKAAKIYFERIVKSESEGILTLNNFVKDNGVKEQFLGINLYKIEFTAEIKFEETGFKCVGSEGIDWRYLNVSIDSTKTCQFNPEGGIYDIYPYKYEKGSIIKITGSVTLEETDNGWRGSSHEISGYHFEGIKPKPAMRIEYKIKIG